MYLLRKFKIRNNAHSAYRFNSECAFNLFTLFTDRYIHVFLFYNCGVSYFLTLSPFHSITFLLLSICKLRGCQEIGSNLARMPTKLFNLFLARKNARILRLYISLIMNQLYLFRQLSPSFYPSKTP